jgi:sRNA-binding carbon storage regulator CsrA
MGYVLLPRRRGEALVFADGRTGERITVRVHEKTADVRVLLAVEAPQHFKIHRAERPEAKGRPMDGLDWEWRGEGVWHARWCVRPTVAFLYRITVNQDAMFEVVRKVGNERANVWSEPLTHGDLFKTLGEAQGFCVADALRWK